MSSTTTALAESVVRSLVTSTDAGASVYMDLQPSTPTADTAADLGLRWGRLAAS